MKDYRAISSSPLSLCSPGVACLLLVMLPSTGALDCLCSSCEGDVCQTSGACFVQTLNQGTSKIRGCVTSENLVELCNVQSNPSIVCCYENNCNHWAASQSRQLRIADNNQTGDKMENGNTSSSDEKLRMIAIVTGAVCILCMTLAISLSFSFFYCYCCRERQRQRRRRSEDVEGGESPSPALGPVAFQPQSISLKHLSQSSTYPLSCLQQRHIIQHLALEKNLEKGRFCETYTGTWRRDKVVVKVYSEKSEKIWFAESKLHQLRHMRHNNIHCFYAADQICTQESCSHYLVLEYHRPGSLYEYLQSTVLHVYHVLMFAMSVADGLSYLHSEFTDQFGKKPAIVHRNVTSESIYVKADGTCCISDFSLAITGDSNVEAELKSRPQTEYRYLAPEFLANPASQNNLESLKKGDMYSYGLVLWEIARRCTVQGMVEDVSLPYSDMLQSCPPSLEEMRDIVFTQDQRPPVPDQWNRDENMRIVLRTITECWHGNSTVRLSPLRVKKTLWKQSQQIQPKMYDKNGKLLSIARTDTNPTMV